MAKAFWSSNFLARKNRNKNSSSSGTFKFASSAITPRFYKTPRAPLSNTTHLELANATRWSSAYSFPVFHSILLPLFAAIPRPLWWMFAVFRNTVAMVVILCPLAYFLCGINKDKWCWINREVDRSVVNFFKKKNWLLTSFWRLNHVAFTEWK